MRLYPTSWLLTGTQTIYPDRNCRNEELRTHETLPYFMASDWYPDYIPRQELQKWGGKDSWNFTLLHGFWLVPWLPRQELQKWGGKHSWNFTLYFMTSCMVLTNQTGTAEMLVKNSLIFPLFLDFLQGPGLPWLGLQKCWAKTHKTSSLFHGFLLHGPRTMPTQGLQKC